MIATADDAHRIRWALYGDNPALLMRDRLGMRLPPKPLAFVLWVAAEARAARIIRAIVKAPRGGGKSKLFSGLEFWLWRFLDWDITNLGGSKAQADRVYSYLSGVLSSEDCADVIDKSIQSETSKREGAGIGWIRVLAASQKQVRSPHAGDETRGGALLADEVCEMEDDLIDAAEPIVDTANPSCVIYSSTFHKAFGRFQERWDAGDWKRFEWDCFDISQKCEYPCKGKQWEKEGGTCPVWDYCGGRAHKSEGWMRIDEIIQGRRDHDREWFEVEMLGMRPSTGGLVYAPDLLKAAFGGKVPDAPGARPSIGIDWGFAGETFLVKTALRDGRIWVDVAMVWSQTPDDEIIAYAVSLAKACGAEIMPDASHPFQNDALRSQWRNVRPVAFAQEKERGIGNIRALLERGVLKIPDASPAHKRLYGQMKNYKRDEKTGKPVKKDDHGPDALLCACLRYDAAWFSESQFRAIEIAPRREAATVTVTELERGPTEADLKDEIMGSIRRSLWGG